MNNLLLGGLGLIAAGVLGYFSVSVYPWWAGFGYFYIFFLYPMLAFCWLAIVVGIPLIIIGVKRTIGKIFLDAQWSKSGVDLSHLVIWGISFWSAGRFLIKLSGHPKERFLASIAEGRYGWPAAYHLSAPRSISDLLYYSSADSGGGFLSVIFWSVNLGAWILMTSIAIYLLTELYRQCLKRFGWKN